MVTELFFRQAVGRLVRWISGLPNQKAYVYLPDDRMITRLSDCTGAPVMLRPPATSESDDEFTPATIERKRSKAEPAAEQLSLFSVLSSAATSMTVHAFTNMASRTTTRRVAEPDGSVAIGDVLELPIHDAGFQLAVDRCRRPEGRMLEQNLSIAKRLVDFTGWSHGKVQRN